jgi:hypothetical protein
MDTNTHRTIEELNGAVLPIQSAEKLYKECRNDRRCSGRLAFPENCLVNIPWKRLGKHVPGATVRYTRSQGNSRLTRSRGNGSVLLLCRCTATGAVIQFFQKCKWSYNEQNHIGEVGDDSFTVRSHQTHRETEKQIYIRSTNGSSDKHHICPVTGPWNGPQRKGHPIVVQLPSNRSRHPIFPKM